eukprot:g15954.t1
MPKPTRQAGCLTRGDLARFVQKLRADDAKIGAAAEVAFKTAARISDVLALRVADMQTDCIRIGDIKSRGRKREIPLPGRAIASQHIRGKKKGEKVFQFSRQYFCRKIREARATFRCRAAASCRAADITTHSFRRSAITLLHNRGADLHSIAAISGHKSTESLAR